MESRFRSPKKQNFTIANKLNKHFIKIEYCTQCRWMIRAAWMAQELLQTFEEETEEVSLKPGKGGVFDIFVNGQLVYSRKENGRMPEITELKRLLRDIIAPDKDLGHSEGK